MSGNGTEKHDTTTEKLARHEVQIQELTRRSDWRDQSVKDLHEKVDGVSGAVSTISSTVSQIKGYLEGQESAKKERPTSKVHHGAEQHTTVVTGNDGGGLRSLPWWFFVLVGIVAANTPKGIELIGRLLGVAP